VEHVFVMMYVERSGSSANCVVDGITMPAKVLTMNKTHLYV